VRSTPVQAEVQCPALEHLRKNCFRIIGLWRDIRAWPGTQDAPHGSFHILGAISDKFPLNGFLDRSCMEEAVAFRAEYKQFFLHIRTITFRTGAGIYHVHLEERKGVCLSAMLARPACSKFQQPRFDGMNV